jgi:dTDP-4-dehydrorhamnose reductase
VRAIVTGASGTVGKALMRALRAGGHEAVAWDRNEAPIDDYWAMESFVRSQSPDVLFHLAIPSTPSGRENEPWLVGWHWPSELAWITRTLGVRFVFASTVLVWTDRTPGPLRTSTPTDATDSYGGGKARAEERVRSQNPDTRIARLGWQIGEAPGGNNMLQYFEEQAQREGAVRASTRWFPSCSLLTDTSIALIRLAERDPDLYLINSNRDMSFFEIASALSARHGGRWPVEATEDYACDQRMVDERVGMPELRQQLMPWSSRSSSGAAP